MAGAGISGKDGDVKIASTQIAEITKWSWNPKANVPKYASNKTAGYKAAVAGVKDGSGSMEGKWDPAIPATAVIAPGTSVTLKLYINATQFWSVPSITEGFKHDVDLDTGEIVGWSCDFQSNGAWTDPVAGLMFGDELGIRADDETGQIFVPAGGLRTDGVEPSDAEKSVERATEEAVRLKFGRERGDVVKEAVEAALAAQKPVLDRMAVLLEALAERAAVDPRPKEVAEPVPRPGSD